MNCFEDRKIVEIAAGNSLAINLTVSFSSALFQQIVAGVRSTRRSDTSMDPAFHKIARLSAPIDMLRLGGYAARNAASPRFVESYILTQAQQFASELSAVMESSAKDFHDEIWVQSRDILLEKQQWLAKSVRPIKDSIICSFRDALMLPKDDRPIDAVLVSNMADASGAHSHPVTIDVNQFSNDALIESLFHEIGHELLDRAVGHNGTGISIINDALRKAQKPPFILFEVVHLFLFFQMGFLVQQHCDDKYTPLIFKGKRMERLLGKLRVTGHQEDIIALLEARAKNEVELEELSQYFAKIL